jgi:tetratricopeptide (TPR) repeat protein
VAALAGLGRAALEKRDYEAAAKYLEDALAADPDAESLHTQLAAAYRGLGRLDQAEPHLRQWRNREVSVPDPLGMELDLLLESGLSYELRGIRALETRDWKTAAAFFRKGLTLSRDNTPLTRSLHHKLGTALFLSGDATGAMEQFEEVSHLAPPDAPDESASKAHYSLGLLLDEKGRHADAIDHLTAALTYQPNYVEAHLALGDALRRRDQPKRALAHYDEVMQINPRSSQARLGRALALAALGRWEEARDWLIESRMAYPDRPEYAIALARLLAAAPEARVRDGGRALDIASALLKQQKTTDVGEALAMALAEIGDYDQAIGIQRGILASAQKAGLARSVQRMTENLHLYERRQPCRKPWPPDQPLVLSESPAASVAAAVRR